MADEKELYEEIDVETITLEMEDDTTQEFAILVTFQVDGKDYAALAPIMEDASIGEDTFFVGYEEDGEEVIISSIDDDAEAERVEKAFDDLCEEE